MVHDNVGSRLDLSFDDMGEQQLKNIARSQSASLWPPLDPPRRHHRTADKAVHRRAALHQHEWRREQDAFADGLTEDLITDLSRNVALFVIARHSTFAYKGKPVDVRHVARDLGVRYVLEGSARRAAARLRINAQLIDAIGGGNHIWAERFDTDIVDIFQVQDEVTKKVVDAIARHLKVEVAVVVQSRASEKPGGL